jgi:hypothetical protein
MALVDSDFGIYYFNDITQERLFLTDEVAPLNQTYDILSVIDKVIYPTDHDYLLGEQEINDLYFSEARPVTIIMTDIDLAEQ